MTTLQVNNVSELARLTDSYLQHYFAFYPTIASSLGLHAYDGQVMDARPAAVQARIAVLREYQQHVATIDRASLSRLEAFDYDLLQWQINLELWQWTDEREYTYNPLIYAYDAMVDGYIKRDYAPLPWRTCKLIEHLHAIPGLLATTRQNLQRSIPRMLVEEAISVYEGLYEFLYENLEEPLQPLHDDALLAEVWAARDVAGQAIAQFRTFLEQELLPAAHNRFAIGAERFCKMLRYNELIDIPLDRLLAIGEADLHRNQQAIIALAHQIDPHKTIQEQMHELGRNHPTADELIDETKALLQELRRFLQERDLITLPPDTNCRVEPTPPFARWAFAMMETAGPFEDESAESFYYVTLPEPGWSAEQIEGWMTKFDYATLISVSIHETYPGHFVHFATARNAPSQMAKVFATYTHYESWAHYVEEMMLEQGYGAGNLHLRMAQLAEALVRNCRYVCAIKMHTMGMTLPEVTRFFMEHAYMDEMTAAKEARRGTYDPGYLNYTLGKLLLLKTLEQYREAYGADFSLKRFHDEYIGYGSPPIPILRKLILPVDNGVLL
ncbi:MAG: DUF885 domain-containing protein [Chloroflexaceae bacterium]|nr:DUF885 domain-containing protein [Chloroflexaceae bacterium]NJO04302.1 DUF885 domain-containing protein [Chloroflexaceae bacterium]